MTVAIYSPYLSSGIVGGGEKHILEFARIAAKKHKVVIALSQSQEQIFAERINKLRHKLEDFLGWSTKLFTFVPTPLGTSASPISKLAWTRNYDYLYAVTDGSLFFSLAKKNNLHIQVPFTNKKTSLMDRLKLLNWSLKNANSEFTKEIVQKSWNTTIPFVQYPLVSDDVFYIEQKKKKTILSVGRFFRQLHSKRQDVLIEAFRLLRNNHSDVFHDWELVLCGPKEDSNYAEELEAKAEGLPVLFKYAVKRNDLIDLYSSSRLYWHAAGFEQDEHAHPELVEHFGISIVEAMAAGAIPIAVGNGGPKETLTGDLKQLQWQTVAECVAITNQIISSTSLEKSLRQKCLDRATDFNAAAFERSVWNML